MEATWTIEAGPDAGRQTAYASHVVGLRGDLYAIPQMGETVLLPWLQRYHRPMTLPAVPSWVAGLVGVRGTAHLVVDLGLLLGLGGGSITESTRLIFLEWGEHQAGFIVDEEVGIRYLVPPESVVAGDIMAGQTMMDGRLVKIINADVVLSHLTSAMNTLDGVIGH